MKGSENRMLMLSGILEAYNVLKPQCMEDHECHGKRNKALINNYCTIHIGINTLFRNSFIN